VDRAQAARQTAAQRKTPPAHKKPTKKTAAAAEQIEEDLHSERQALMGRFKELNESMRDAELAATIRRLDDLEGKRHGLALKLLSKAKDADKEDARLKRVLLVLMGCVATGCEPNPMPAVAEASLFDDAPVYDPVAAAARAAPAPVDPPTDAEVRIRKWCVRSTRRMRCRKRANWKSS